MRLLLSSLAFVLLMPTAGSAADHPILKDIDRQIKKQPNLVARQPLYGLLVFGSEAQKRIWMVLDKSKPTADVYDVLYVDLNVDGDLTGLNERATGQEEGGSIRFHLPDLIDPVTKAVHTQFNARVTETASPTVMVSVRWKGRFKMGGGYPEDPENQYLKFGDKPATAPVLWADGDSPFRFQRWYSGKLPIGAADDFKVFVGQPGSGPNSFWAFQEHFLPEAEGVQATLIYRDVTDKEQRVTSLLKERC